VTIQGYGKTPKIYYLKRLIIAAVRCGEAAWRDGWGVPPRHGDHGSGERPYGRDTLFPAATGIERRWKMRAAHRSTRYTTRPDELPCVRA
jgi:hypothetical protein